MEAILTENLLKGLSLSTRGARLQFRVAIALISVLPLLVVLYLAPKNVWISGRDWAMWSVLLTSLALSVGSGYWILSKYPFTIVRLRLHLENIVSGELPDKITLLEKEDDIAAVERSINLILCKLKEENQALQRQLYEKSELQKTIEGQQKKLIEVEQQRVMLESLGTACHHLGQPVTVLMGDLTLLGRTSHSPDADIMLDECMRATNSIVDILERFRNVSDYRTEHYLTPQTGAEGLDFAKILTI